jgi:anti-sigma factor ChrR (cupin superfamily)
MAHDEHLAHELAANYLTGGMSDAEQRQFEAHVDEECCALCREQLGRLTPVVEALLAAVEPLAPPARLRDELLRRAGQAAPSAAPGESLSQPGKLPDPGSIFVVRADEGQWQAIDIPGVFTRVLYLDAGQRRVTALVRMQPGAVFPAHVHEQAEECLVLEGELTSGDLHLSVGDYQRIPAGVPQQETTTRDGCLLLVNSPLD